MDMRPLLGFVMIALPVFLGWYIVTMLIGGVTILSLVFGLASGALFAQLTTLSLFTFTCPENTAYLGVNTITGGFFLVRQGLSFKYPWDNVADSNRIALLHYLEELEVIATTSERAQVRVKSRISWSPNVTTLESAAKFISLGGSSQAQETVRSALRVAFERAAQVVMAGQNLGNYNQLKPWPNATAARDAILSKLSVGGGRSALESSLGIEVIGIEIGEILPTEVTQALNTLRVKFQVYCEQALEMARIIPGMDPKSALDALLAADPDSNALKVMGNGFVFLHRQI